jgi:hypothetical protein
MAISLSVSQSGGKLRVYADNSGGDHVAIIDHIILSIDGNGSSWHTWHYQDDFYFGSGRVPTGWAGLMVEMNYSGGKAKAHATADYWEVDQSVKSPTINIS